MKSGFTISIFVLILVIVMTACENAANKTSYSDLQDSVIISPDTTRLAPVRIILKDVEVSPKTITGSGKFLRSRVMDEIDMNRLSLRSIDSSTAPGTAGLFKYHLVDTLFSNSRVTAILIGREYAEENILWLATYDNYDKLLDRLMVYYDNSEGAMQVGSVIKNNEVQVTSINEYAESPREAKKIERYQVDENSRFVKIQ